MDRREFLRACAAMGLAVGIPGVVNCEPGAQLIELVDYRIDDRKIREAIVIGRVIKVEGDRVLVDCSFDTEKGWQAVTLEDSRGHIWMTENGERWTCGKEWFEVSRIDDYV